MQADKMFSKVTVTSGRTLLSVASIIVASSVLDFKLEQLPLVAQGQLSNDKLMQIAIPLIIFLMIAHTINWFNDHNGHVFDGLEKFSARILPNAVDQNLYSDFFLRVRNKQNSADEHPVDDEELHKYFDRLQAFTKRFAYFRRYSNVNEYVAFYGQHLALPLGMAVWGIWVACSSLS